MSKWVVHLNQAAPRSKLETPISATAYEALLACPLQLLYSRDQSFPRRNGPFARIGVAFHKALEAIPAVLGHEDPGGAIEALLVAFRSELEAQKVAAGTNPREAAALWPEGRAHHAEQALALLLHRIWPMRADLNAHGRGPRTEVDITSRDGFLRGIIDRVDRTDEGIVVVDYKSAETYDDDHLARFRRQLLLYAYLWFDTRGDWPVQGVINFVLLGRELPVPISAEESEQLVGNIRSAFEAAKDLRGAKAARPGPACKQCDYRPWCGPFWERAAGLEGSVQSIEGVVASKSSASPRVIWVRHDGNNSQVVLDDSHLARNRDLAIGSRIRLIDVIVDGAPPVGRYRLTDRSEIWSVT